MLVAPYPSLGAKDASIIKKYGNITLPEEAKKYNPKSLKYIGQGKKEK
jgi:hypothetical protein